MLPIRDENPTARFPSVTVVLIVANIIAFLYQLSLDPGPEHLVSMGHRAAAFIQREALVPYIFVHAPGLHSISSLFISMFLHGGFVHLGGNMLFLWIFGNNVEDILGHFRFIVFYLVCGLFASLGQVLIDINGTMPIIGASGAISGVLGAYLVKFPLARVVVFAPYLWFLGVFTFRVPALFFLGFWIFFQLQSGFSPGPGPEAEHVAWFAHIGGFFAGLALIFLLKQKPTPYSAKR